MRVTLSGFAVPRVCVRMLQTSAFQLNGLTGIITAFFAGMSFARRAGTYCVGGDK